MSVTDYLVYPVSAQSTFLVVSQILSFTFSSPAGMIRGNLEQSKKDSTRAATLLYNRLNFFPKSNVLFLYLLVWVHNFVSLFFCFAYVYLFSPHTNFFDNIFLFFPILKPSPLSWHSAIPLLGSLICVWNSGSRFVIPGLAASVFLGNLLEIQTLKLHSQTSWIRNFGVRWGWAL